jgi:hypothetical protein
MRRRSWEHTGVPLAASADQTARETNNPNMSVPKYCTGRPPATLENPPVVERFSSLTGAESQVLSHRAIENKADGCNQLLDLLLVLLFPHERNERGLAEGADGTDSADKSFRISSLASLIDTAIIRQALWDKLRKQ